MLCFIFCGQSSRWFVECEEAANALKLRKNGSDEEGIKI